MIAIAKEGESEEGIIGFYSDVPRWLRLKRDEGKRKYLLPLFLLCKNPQCFCVFWYVREVHTSQSEG